MMLSAFSFFVKLSEHLVGVRRLLDRIRQFGLTIRPTKTYVASNEVVFLEYTVRQGRIMPEPSLLKKITLIKVPTTKRQVRSLLSFIHFYSPFIPRYAETVAGLTELMAGPATRTMIKCLLPTRHNDALLRALGNKPFLQLPNLSREFFFLFTRQIVRLPLSRASGTVFTDAICQPKITAP